MHGGESIGELSQMTSVDIEGLQREFRTTLDAYMGALQEPFGNAMVGVFRLDRSTNIVECLRSTGLNSAVFKAHRERLRFSFIGNVLHGTASGFFESTADADEYYRDSLEKLLAEINSPRIYGTRLHVESQSNPLAVIVFLPNNHRRFDQHDIRAFELAARSLSLALERATIDAQIFRNQRIMIAGSMLLGMGHELRNEVQAVGSMADYLVRLISSDAASVGRQEQLAWGVAHVLENSSRLRKLLQSALNLTGRMSEVKRSLGALLDDAIFKCQVMAAKEDVHLQFDVESVALLDCQVTSAMEQVLMNLILNAIQHVRLFRESHEGFVRVSVSSDAAESVENICIRIEDNAFGINGMNKSQLFAPFFTTRREGTGLGLSVARSLVKARHGLLDIEWSYIFLGSCFLLRLPLKG
jgi:signal transduction histidine kinase